MRRQTQRCFEQSQCYPAVAERLGPESRVVEGGTGPPTTTTHIPSRRAYEGETHDRRTDDPQTNDRQTNELGEATHGRCLFSADSAALAAHRTDVQASVWRAATSSCTLPLSRDNGITRRFFSVACKVTSGAIRSFPPDLRWFAQDADDEALLTELHNWCSTRPAEPGKPPVGFSAGACWNASAPACGSRQRHRKPCRGYRSRRRSLNRQLTRSCLAALTQMD
jgi:hypothetical protein